MKKRNAAKNVLDSSIIVSVFVFNEDGLNCSEEIKAELRDMGATVQDAFSPVTQTHLIFSNGDEKILAAAKIFNIRVVSYLWVKQCKDAGYKVDEVDFAVTPSTSTSVTTNRRMEPVIGQVF